MKKLTLILIAVLGVFVWSCESDDTADIIIENNTGGGGGGTTPTSNGIGGTQTADLTLEVGQEYILSEALVMSAGTTLTIPAGAVIKANPGAGVYIAIAQDVTEAGHVRLVVAADHGFEGCDEVADDVLRGVVEQGRQPPLGRKLWIEARG